jgi:hypothetical protein
MRDLIKVKDGEAGLDQDKVMDDEIGYHSSRALAELDQARRCPDADSARCHLQLAEQHLDRMRALARPASASDILRPGPA